jgi:hypothetical protein
LPAGAETAEPESSAAHAGRHASREKQFVLGGIVLSVFLLGPTAAATPGPMIAECLLGDPRAFQKVQPVARGSRPFGGSQYSSLKRQNGPKS